MNTSKSTTILIVDDESPILQALRIRLEHARYEVIAARDVASACQLARENVPDIALLDVNLPGGTGFELADKLDRLSQKTIYKVFISASRNQDNHDRAWKCGAVAYLEKPFSTEQLFEALTEIDERRYSLPDAFA